MKKHILILSIGVLLSTVAQAQKKPQPDFNGGVSKSEFTDKVADHFQEADADRDGVLSAQEAEKLPKWLRGAKPSGKSLSILDVQDAAQTKFTASAKTNSKVLTAQEFKSLEAGK